MEDFLNQVIGYFYVFLFFFQMIFRGVSGIAIFAILAWTIVDIQTFRKMDGNLKRGIKISSKPLSSEIRHYLESLSGDIVEYRETPFGKDISAFIRKQDGEILVHAKQWYGFRHRRSWPFIGYVNLLSPVPVLEFRSSLPFHLLLISLALSIILLPFIVGMWAFSYSMDTRTIEKFLQSKVESSTSEKVGASSWPSSTLFFLGIIQGLTEFIPVSSPRFLLVTFWRTPSKLCWNSPCLKRRFLQSRILEWKPKRRDKYLKN